MATAVSTAPTAYQRFSQFVWPDPVVQEADSAPELNQNALLRRVETTMVVTILGMPLSYLITRFALAGCSECGILSVAACAIVPDIFGTIDQWRASSRVDALKAKMPALPAKPPEAAVQIKAQTASKTDTTIDRGPLPHGSSSDASQPKRRHRREGSVIIYEDVTTDGQLLTARK